MLENLNNNGYHINNGTATLPGNSTTTAKKVTLTNPPKILVTSGDKEIPYVIGLNKWNGTIYDREATFQMIMEKDSDIKIPYIPLEETIQIVYEINK